MATYTISITEYWNRSYKVEANTEEEAIQKVTDRIRGKRVHGMRVAGRWLKDVDETADLWSIQKD